MKKINFKKIAMKAAGVSGGVAIGLGANKIGFIANLNPKIKGGAMILVGAILPEFAPKSSFVSDMGAGVIAVGAGELVKSFIPGLESSTVSGIGEESEYITDAEYRLQGVDDENAINGDPENAIHGIGDDNEETY